MGLSCLGSQAQRQQLQLERLHLDRLQGYDISAFVSFYCDPPPPYTPPKPTDAFASPLSPPSYDDVNPNPCGDVTVTMDGTARFCQQREEVSDFKKL